MDLSRIREAADNAATAEQALRDAEHELDAAIAEARENGETIETLMEAANRSRQGIYNALRRAPKPKPAWHDAVAVIAHTDDGHIRQVWERGHVAELLGAHQVALGAAPVARAVTPLIEAKVTDETARTVLDRYYETEAGHDWPDDTVALMRLAITAALGLETE